MNEREALLELVVLVLGGGVIPGFVNFLIVEKLISFPAAWSKMQVKLAAMGIGFVLAAAVYVGAVLLSLFPLPPTWQDWVINLIIYGGAGGLGGQVVHAFSNRGKPRGG